MKIVDAFWEERNLGVTCYELQMELTDDFQKVTVKLNALPERQYMVAKIPSSRYDLACLVQDRGYSFIETAIALEINFKKLGYRHPDIPKRLQKICDRCSWNVMDEADLIQLSDEIKKNIFKTDRVFTDSAFSREQAARRYDLWVRDLVSQGCIPYKVLCNQEIIGFFLNKEIAPGVFDGILAASYSDYIGSGMGYCIQYAGVMQILSQGGNKCLGHVSGNNPTVLKILISLGFDINGLEYVFVKHNHKEEEK